LRRIAPLSFGNRQSSIGNEGPVFGCGHAAWWGLPIRAG